MSKPKHMIFSKSNQQEMNTVQAIIRAGLVSSVASETHVIIGRFETNKGELKKIIKAES